MRNGRGDRGRFLPGAPAGPGRPRKGRRSPRAVSLFAELVAIVDERLSGSAALEAEDALGASELLVRHLRQRRASASAGGLPAARTVLPARPLPARPVPALLAAASKVAGPEHRRFLTLLRARGGTNL